MQNNLTNTLNELQVIMQEMLNQATDSNWENVELMDEKRLSLLNTLPPASALPLSLSNKHTLDTVFKLDKKLLSLSEIARTQAALKINQLSTKKNGCEQYLRHQL
jgi:hypothetical protein